MSSSVVRRRSWLAAAAVLGLVGSLLAVGVVAPPAGGAAGEADNEAQFSACVGPALVSQGLVDVVGSFSEDAVNCLGHYNVTKGRTETLYDPGAPVRRWQMALFLSRAAVPAGVVLPAAPADEFTDLGEASDETRAAVNQMADLGIMPGVSSTSFRPDVNVTRAQMALMLDAFLGKAQAGAGAFGGDVMDYPDDVNPDDEVFGDIGQVTRGEYPAIRRMFEVGVARGTSDGRFNPGGLVTRAQMAVFITRMLAHTAARPVGVTLQVSETAVTTADSVDLAVSVRGPDLMGVPDAKVDVFSAVEADDAFGEDGRCSSDAVLAVTHTTACEIVVGDESTDASGDYSTTVGPWADSLTVWGWSGEVGDRFDSDDVSASSVAITVTKPGVKLKVSDDMADNATAAKFGASVVFTVQVVDDDGEAVALEGVKFNVGVRESSLSGAEGASAVHNSYGRSYETDDDGMVEFTFRQTDPRSDSTGDAAWLDLDIGPGSKAGAAAPFAVDDKTTLKMAGVEAGNDQAAAAVVWLDTAAVPSVLKLSQDIPYHEASDAGSGAGNTVRATLTDQYGDPVSRQRIHFTSDDPDGVGQEASDVLTEILDVGDEWRVVLDLLAKSRYTKTTNRQGVAALTYNRKNAEDRIETISARFVRNADDATVEDLDDRDDLLSEDLYHYWTSEPSGGATTFGRVLHIDSDNKRLVFSSSDSRVLMVDYDSNDHFDGVDGPTVLAEFEKGLDATGADAAKHLELSDYAASAKGVSRFMLNREWSSLARADSLMNDPDGLDSYGFEYASDGGVIAVGAYKAAVGSGEDRKEEAGQVFVYDGPNDASPAVLTAPAPAAAARFGYSVAVSGDTIAVGEPRRLSAAAGRTTLTDGAVYVFTKPAGGWEGEISTAVKLTDEGNTIDPPKPTSVSSNRFNDTRGHQLGFKVAISGDGNVIAAGAPRDLATCGAKGSVLLYTKPNTGWADSDGSGTVQLAGGDCTALHPTNDGWVMDWNDQFGGERIALDQTGETVVVGAPLIDLPVRADDGSYTEFHDDAGAAYLFHEPSGGWSTTSLTASSAQLLSPSPTRRERVGKSVSVSDDGETVVIAANGRADRRIEGKALVFTAPEGGWAESTGWADNAPSAADARTTVIGSAMDDPAAELVGPEGRRYGGELFGQWVDMAGDGAKIIASRSLRAEGGLRGSLHVFTRPAGGWADSSTSVEYLGSAPDTELGWRSRLDRRTGSIFTAEVELEASENVDSRVIYLIGAIE